MKRILATGGAGYINSHMCKALGAAVFEPIVYDDMSNGHLEAVRFDPLAVGDVRDSSALAACMLDHRIEAVIHFAGLIGSGARSRSLRSSGTST